MRATAPGQWDASAEGSEGGPCTDSQALRLMLDYVAAECRRLGAPDAALAAAQAARLLGGVRRHDAQH
jgi:hypothetical protein